MKVHWQELNTRFIVKWKNVQQSWILIPTLMKTVIPCYDEIVTHFNSQTILFNVFAAFAESDRPIEIWR